ncbi:hypothetical protein RJ640_002716 [Escallonia rubra]|uniref:Uncharacterized protein n=1 Tax=Escallonia rubra TaxID=112253 RepID=A0AA88R872_9ASTE|nr:hypothetical protein RJ640_002716 [Escallonia rubra]
MASFLQLVMCSLLVLAFSFTLFKWLFNPPKTETHRNLPPSPSKLPIIGNLHQLNLYPHRVLQTLSQLHGPIMMIQLGSMPTLIISSASVASEIMSTRDLAFSNRPFSSISAKLLYNCRDVAMAPYGDYWRRVKNTNKRVQSFRNVREEETTYMVEKIKECSQSSLLVNLSELLEKLTSDVVCRRKYSGGDSGKELKELLEKRGKLLGAFHIADYIPWLAWLNYLTGLNLKVEKVACQTDEFLEGVVEEHLKKGASDENQQEETSFVDILLSIQDIERVTIKAVILDMFAAGADTTYTVLEWAMTELLRHPHLMSKLQTEVRAILSTEGAETEDAIEHMHYLKAVIKETLRLHPPVPLLLSRESTQDVKVMGYDIRAGTQVITNAWAIGRDPISWDRAEEFSPERFLESSIDFKGRNFQLIPFGAGRRGYPGVQFAVSVVELALAKIVHTFNWELPGGRRESMDMTETTGLTVHKKDPLLAVPTS